LAQLTSSPYLLILISVLLGTVGQLFLKQGMNNINHINQLAGKATPEGMQALLAAVKAIPNPVVFTGFLFYGMSSVLWLMILKKVPLSTAYPMISLSYVFVVALSTVLFRERPNLAATAPGLFLIIVGVTLIGLGSGK
jgi:drug/metabolite transporter (DMT)-like permease